MTIDPKNDIPIYRSVNRGKLWEKQADSQLTAIQWDRCLSNLLIKSTLGLGFGVVFSVLLFKRRSWPAIVGLGFGAGRAYEECNSSLKQAAREIRKQA